MNAKDFLSQAMFIDQEINAKLNRLSSLKALTTQTSFAMKETLVCHARNVHRLQDIVAKIADLTEEINQEIDHLVNLKREISDCIGNVPVPECRILLEQRYLCYFSWADIADQFGYGMSNIYRLHKKALTLIKTPELGSKME